MINAIEAIDDQAGPREITVQAGRRTASVEITIQDTGPGLPAEAEKHLFQPFFTTKPDGLGLGLVVSQSIVEAHDGNLWVTPNTGPGVTFHFTLPVAGAGEPRHGH